MCVCVYVCVCVFRKQAWRDAISKAMVQRWSDPDFKLMMSGNTKCFYKLRHFLDLKPSGGLTLLSAGWEYRSVYLLILFPVCWISSLCAAHGFCVLHCQDSLPVGSVWGTFFRDGFRQLHPFSS